MVEWVMSLLGSWDPTFISDLFIIGTLLLFLAAVYSTAKGMHQPFILFAPTLLTSIGILGTFTGITIGLANFDYTDQSTIDRSIPLLLGGLKMAFITSIVGMGTSIVAKAFATWKARVREVATEDVGAAEILEALEAQQESLEDLRRAIAGEGDASVVTQLQKVRTDIQDGLKDTRRLLGAEGEKSLAERLDAASADIRAMGDSLHGDLGTLATLSEDQKQVASQVLVTQERIRLAIAGEGDTPLVTQVQRARSDMQEGFAGLRAVLSDGPDSVVGLLSAGQTKVDEALAGVRADLKDFAEKVSELGSKALIEALSEVIRDFNTKLSEQFGDNFKRLDESVGKLLEWQENYKDQMADMKLSLEQAVVAVQASKEALAAVEQHATAIPGLIGRLEEVITAAYVQLDDLQRHLQAFADVRDAAVKAVPEIKAVLDKTFDEIRKAVDAASTHYQTLLTGSKTYIEKFLKESDQWLDLVSTALKDGSQQIVQATTDTQKVLRTTADTLKSSAEDVSRHLEKATTELGKALEDYVSKLQENMSRLLSDLAAQVQQLTRELEKQNAKAATERTELINKEIEAIDKAMQDEISRVMQVMANNLVQITNKFVQDYTQLTHAMREVVSQAKQTTGGGATGPGGGTGSFRSR